VDKVVWVYGVDQEEHYKFAEEHKFVSFTSEFDETQLTPGTLLILDDLQSSISSGSLKKPIQDFVIRSVSHCHVSIIIVLHNLYCPNIRTISLNMKYLCFFNSIRDASVISVLGRQSFPQNKNFLKDVYSFVMQRNSRGYLFLDFSVFQPNRFRVRDNVDALQALFFVPV